MVKFGHLDAMMKVHWAVIRAKTAQNLQHNKLNCQKIASESLPAIHIQRFYWVMDESMHVAHSAIHTAPWDWIWKVNSSRPSKLCQAKNLSTSNLELITWWCWLNLVKSIRLAVPSKGNWDAYHHEHHRAKHDEEKDNCWSQAFLLHGMSSLLMQFGPQRTVRLSVYRNRSDGSVYAFGLNNYNQLGIVKKNSEAIFTPQKTPFENVKLITGKNRFLYL